MYIYMSIYSKADLLKMKTGVRGIDQVGHATCYSRCNIHQKNQATTNIRKKKKREKNQKSRKHKTRGKKKRAFQASKMHEKKGSQRMWPFLFYSTTGSWLTGWLCRTVVG